MEIVKIYSVDDIPKITASLSATIGEFDGIHLAHQTLFNKVIELSKKKNTLSAVITFDPHPDELISKKNVKSIFTLEEKIKHISNYSFDYLFIINFDETLLTMPHYDFTSKFLIPLKIVNLVVGFDFKYGYKGLGNKDTIKEEGIENVIVIDEIVYDNNIISTTYIKKLLANGEVEKANKLLDKNFSIAGTVIHGRNVGQKINVPTANLKLSNNYPTLLEGVYAVFCIIDHRRYQGIANIGHNPSFNYYQNLSYEIHIIEENFNIDLYDQNIRVEFIKFLRNEIVFDSIESFLQQIKKDKKEAINILNNAL